MRDNDNRHFRLIGRDKVYFALLRERVQIFAQKPLHIIEIYRQIGIAFHFFLDIAIHVITKILERDNPYILLSAD